MIISIYDAKKRLSGEEEEVLPNDTVIVMRGEHGSYLISAENDEVKIYKQPKGLQNGALSILPIVSNVIKVI